MKHYKILFFTFILIDNASFLLAQGTADSLKNAPPPVNADDPSQFITRVEVFNELQYYNEKDFYFNQTVARAIVKLGKRFSTRLDVPYVYNSLTPPEGDRKSGLGDISVRLLGFSFLNKPKAAVTLSMEATFNTASSPLIGTGKNLLTPLLSYSQVFPKQNLLLALTFQQTNSIWGDENRSKISFSKFQFILIKKWTPKIWTVIDPELMIDYVHGGASMVLRSRVACAPTPRINLWVTPSVGLFGDFIARYQWSAEIGSRFFFGSKRD